AGGAVAAGALRGVDLATVLEDARRAGVGLGQGAGVDDGPQRHEPEHRRGPPRDLLAVDGVLDVGWWRGELLHHRRGGGRGRGRGGRGGVGGGRRGRRGVGRGCGGRRRVATAEAEGGTAGP